MKKISITEAAKRLNMDRMVLSASIRAGAFSEFALIFENPKNKRGYSIIIWENLLTDYINKRSRIYD